MLTAKPTDIIALCADLHVNDTVGLCPPEFERADGEIHLPSVAQRATWKAWQAAWQVVAERKAATGARVYVVFNGDVGDLNTHSSSQLVTTVPAKVQEAMVTATAPAVKVADHTFVVRGTEAHSGPLGTLEEQFAADIGAERASKYARSWNVLTAQIGGVPLEVAHHPPTGSKLPDKRNQAAARGAALMVTRAVKHGYKPARLYAWGHLHYSAWGEELGATAFMIPPFKLVGAYGYRLGTGSHMEPVGILLWELAAGEWRHEFLHYHLRRPTQWTSNLTSPPKSS